MGPAPFGRSFEGSMSSWSHPASPTDWRIDAPPLPSNHAANRHAAARFAVTPLSPKEAMRS